MSSDALLAENSQLRTENDSLRANLEAVQFQLEQLKRLVFGHRSEKLVMGDAGSGFLFPITSPPEPAAASPAKDEEPKPPRQKPKRTALPAALPREVEVIDLPADQKACPACGSEREVIGELITEKLEYVPATLKVLQFRRPKYACAPCQGEVAVAKLPAFPIEQGIATAGLLAHVLVSKFADHLPLNRQEAMLRRQGIELPRSTLCDWVLGSAELLKPLYEVLVKAVLADDILHSDDTIIPLQEKGATVKGRAWAYLSPASSLVAYEFTASRAGAHPQGFLGTWEGHLVVDAYSGYDRLFLNPRLQEVGCWSHGRRKFVEVAKVAKTPGLAQEAVERIATFFHLDNAWADLPAQERRRRRLNELKPHVDAFHAWMAAHLPSLLPQSPLAKAMGYVQNHWQALTRFFDDGRLPLTNNAAERMMRPIAVGRGNWLFVGSMRGGTAAAIILSFIQSAKLLHLNPYAYLRDVLSRLPSARERDLEALLPHRWQPS
jgi:transposase